MDVFFDFDKSNIKPDQQAAIKTDLAALQAVGIAADRLSTISYGKERPFAQGHTESAWKENRRAHVVEQEM